MTIVIRSEILWLVKRFCVAADGYHLNDSHCHTLCQLRSIYTKVNLLERRMHLNDLERARSHKPSGSILSSMTF